MDMGTFALFRRRSSLRGCYDYIAGDVQTNGNFEHGSSSIHQLAEPSMGYQTALESVHRHHKNQALLDYLNAIADRCRTSRNSFHYSYRFISANHSSNILADGIQLSYSRYSSRRILYDRTFATRAGTVCRNKEYLLSSCHNNRTGRAYHACRLSGKQQWKYQPGMEHYFLHSVRTFHRLVALPQIYPTPPIFRH